MLFYDAYEYLNQMSHLFFFLFFFSPPIFAKTLKLTTTTVDLNSHRHATAAFACTVASASVLALVLAQLRLPASESAAQIRACRYLVSPRYLLHTVPRKPLPHLYASCLLRVCFAPTATAVLSANSVAVALRQSFSATLM